MCSSKEKAKNPDAERDADDEPRRQRARLRRALVAIACLLGCAAAAVWLVHRSPEPQLAQARELLQSPSLGEDPAAWAAQGRLAEQPLRRYLQAGGAERSSASLLLAVALMAQGRGRSPLGQGEIARLLSQARTEECATGDLLIAVSFFMASGRLGEADRLIAAALEKGDRRMEVLRRAINLRFHLGRDDDVLAHCGELVRLDPADTFPLRVMGAVYENQTLWDKAIDAYQKLLALAPPDANDVRLRLLESLIITGRVDEARKQFELLRAAAPELLAASPITEASLLHLEGKSEEALARAMQILQSRPDDPKALLLAGRIQVAQAKVDEAIASLGRLTQIDPTDNEAHYLLGQAYARKGETERAAEHLKRHREVLDMRVKLYELERRASRSPGDVQIRLQIAALYDQLGWTDRAEFWRRAAQSAGAAQQP